jgi:hypothetical protein
MKIIHTCTSWSKYMTCISLRSGLWLSKICDASMPHFYIYPKLHSKALVVRYEKEGKISNALVRFHTHWAIERMIWGTYISLQKFIKPPDRWLIKEWMIGESIITVLSCNRPRTWKNYMLHRDQGKGWIKMPTYLNCERILCYRHGTCELYRHSSNSW